MRTVFASVLVLAALAAALLGWFGAGWSGVEQRQAELRAAPRRAAAERARELAAEVAARLEALRIAEARRPFYHYQNLFHDPRGVSEGLAVAPSPLASGPEDSLVRAHFQVRAAGKRGWRIDVPTINDDIPELTDPGNGSADLALRAELFAIAGDLAAAAAGPPVADPTVVAQVEPDRRPPRDTQAPPPGTKHPPNAEQEAQVASAQVYELSQEQYTQNLNPNYVFQQAQENRRNNAPVQQVMVPPPAPTPVPAPAPAADKVEPPRRAAPARREPRRVTIAVAPLEWHEAALGSERALLALRRVETPDGELTQGLVIDDEAVARWVAERVPGARLVGGDAAGGDAAGGDAVGDPVTDESAAATSALRVASASAEVPLGPRKWTVVIPVEGLAAAESAAAAAQSAFWGRFVPVAALATLCGMLVIVVVARAERLARARSQFAAAAAHELRTPLAGLQLYGDMLADGLGDPGKSRQYAHRIAEEASRLGRVVTNVLGFSQLERGDLSVNPRAGDAAEAARAVIDRARPALERAGVVLEVELPESLPARLDPDAVARVLGNLLDNAEKYSRGAAERRVALRGARRADGTVELAVSDSGPGVADGAKLFVPFSRGVGADGPAGLGLGLALSRSLARAMGGDLAHGGGANFVLTLSAA